jgi:repressor LexA
MNNQNQPITPRQLAVLKAVAYFEKNRCYSATIAELAIRLNVSRTTVFEHIAALREKKLLSGTKGKARSLKLTKKASRLLDEIDRTEEFPATSGGSVPLLGDVAAGNPIDAIENRQMLSLTSVFGDGDDIFALEVCGDSMIDAGIDSGDYVLCKRTPNAADGDMVVAIVDEDTATVKRFFRDENQIRLEPANDAYEPIYTDNCRIEGIVLGTMRKF